MTARGRVRERALALPEVGERAHVGTTAFSVRGRPFAWVSGNGAWLRVRLPRVEVEATLRRYPGAELVVRRNTLLGVRLPTADLDDARLDHVLRRSWEQVAPEALVTAHRDTADLVADGPDADGPDADCRGGAAARPPGGAAPTRRDHQDG